MIPMTPTAEDMRLMAAWGVAWGDTARRSRWPYERVMQAAVDRTVVVADQGMQVDGRPAEPEEIRATASLVHYGLCELVPSLDDTSRAVLALTDRGRQQLDRWSTYQPLGGGEQA